MIESIVCLGLIIAAIGILIYAIFTPHHPFYYSFTASLNSIGIPIINFIIDDKEYNFIVDSGSSSSHISTEVLKEHSIETQDIECSCTAAGSSISFNKVCHITLKNAISEFKDAQFFNSPALDASLTNVTQQFDIPIHGLLGGDFLDSFGFIINYVTNTIYYEPNIKNRN